MGPQNGGPGWKNRLLTACGGNDAIHAQVFHHLPVMIGAVPYDANGQSQAVRATLAEGVRYWGDRVCVVDALNRFMNINEGILQVLHDV